MSNPCPCLKLRQGCAKLIRIYFQHSAIRQKKAASRQVVMRTDRTHLVQKMERILFCQRKCILPASPFTGSVRVFFRRIYRMKIMLLCALFVLAYPTRHDGRNLFIREALASAEKSEVERANTDFSVAIVDGKALFRLGWADNLCAITFDDGPSPHTSRLLDILKEQGVLATFFVVGNQVRRRPALVRRIQDEGHEIANHTFSHVTLRHRDPAVQREEMESLQKLLRDQGIVSRFIRPPYGRYDSETIRIASELGLGIVLWSVDSMDWTRSWRMEKMRTQVHGEKLRGIFLFHDTRVPTVEAMPQIIERLKNGGCRFVTVSGYLDTVVGSAFSFPEILQAGGGITPGRGGSGRFPHGRFATNGAASFSELSGILLSLPARLFVQGVFPIFSPTGAFFLPAQ